MSCGDKLHPRLRVVRYRQLSSRATWPPVNLLSRLFAPFGDCGGGGGVCPGRGQRANEPQRREWWIPGPGSNGGRCHGLAWSLERAPNTGSSRMTNHNKLPARQSSLSLQIRDWTNAVLDSFCRTMIKLSPWGGQFVSSWDLCSNFFRQVCLNWVFSPRALLVGFTPACSLEAKQTAALASYGFPQQHQKLARYQSSSSSEAATLSFLFSHKTTICKTFLLPIVMGVEHKGV